MQGQPLTLCCLGLEKLTSDLGFEPSPFCCWRGYLVCEEVASSHTPFFFSLQLTNFYRKKSLMGSGFVQESVLKSLKTLGNVSRLRVFLVLVSH